MADIKEQIAKIEALAKEDEQFRNDYIAAVKAQDVDGLTALFAEKGFEVTFEDLQAQADEGREIDEAELKAVAGGEGRASKIDDYCGTAGAVMCGMGLGVALWSPDYKSDEGDKWYE